MLVLHQGEGGEEGKGGPVLVLGGQGGELVLPIWLKWSGTESMNSGCSSTLFRTNSVTTILTQSETNGNDRNI